MRTIILNIEFFFFFLATILHYITAGRLLGRQQKAICYDISLPYGNPQKLQVKRKKTQNKTCIKHGLQSKENSATERSITGKSIRETIPLS